MTGRVVILALFRKEQIAQKRAEKEGKKPPKIERSTSDCTAGSYTRLFACKILVRFPFISLIKMCTDHVWHDSLHYHLVGNSFITQLQSCSWSPPSAWWWKQGINGGRKWQMTGKEDTEECVEKVCNLNPFGPMDLPHHSSKLCIQPSPLMKKPSFLLGKITFFNYNPIFTPKATTLEPKWVCIGNIKIMYSSKSFPTEILGVCTNSWNPTLWKQCRNDNYLRFFTLLWAFWD